MNRHVILIGIGQFGCAVAQNFAKTARAEDSRVHVLALDTDTRSEETVLNAPFVSMAHHCKLSDVLDTLDTDMIKEWFPCDRENDCVEYFETLSADEGANQWRMKALLSFYYTLSKDEGRAVLHKHIDDIVADVTGPEENQKPKIEIKITASLAGGTGSALFLPIVLYLKRYLKEHFNISDISASACLALSDVCEDTLTPEQRIKARANTYAAMRELSAINKNALGKCPPFSLRIGRENDGIMGVLYDSEAEEFKNPSGVPFDEVYLFRRTPGVRNIPSQVSIVTDAIRSLCAQTHIPLPATDDLYSGISLTKTVYPLESIVSYISLSLLCDTASEQWMQLYKNAQKELKQMSTARLKYGENTPSGRVLIPHAVQNAVDDLIKDGDSLSALLCRRCDDGDDDSPELVCTDYIELIDRQISDELKCEGSDMIERYIAENKLTANSPDAKRASNVPRVTDIALPDLAGKCRTLLDEYYADATKRADAAKELWQSFLFGTATSVEKNLLTENAVPLNPVYSLARLCALYNHLEQTLEEERLCIPEGAEMLGDAPIPAWILEADVTVHMDCKYDRAGSDRFALLLRGNRSHINKNKKNKTLFLHDLEISYGRIQCALRCVYTEELLRQIEEIISEYYSLFGTLELLLDEKASEAEDALLRYSGKYASCYYVGASAQEKRHLYNAFLEAETDTGMLSKLTRRLDAKLGQAMMHALHRPHQTTPENDIGTMLDIITEIIYDACTASDFYSRVLDKNVLEAVLEQNGKNGSDESDVAIDKALSAATEALVYTLPDTKDSYLYSKAIRRSVTAILPNEAYAYLSEHADGYGGASAENIVQSLLYDAGEHTGTAEFTESLPKNELRVIRLTAGLSLSLVEALSEDSETRDYYKAYLKALEMEERQSTALWNPHIIRGISSTSLPKISGK